MARKWFLDTLLRGLSYAFHQLPSGVLTDPEELEADAEQIERLAADLGRGEALAAVVEYCREQAAVLREFRLRPDRSTCYERFLEARGVEWEDRPDPL